MTLVWATCGGPIPLTLPNVKTIYEHILDLRKGLPQAELLESPGCEHQQLHRALLAINGPSVFSKSTTAAPPVATSPQNQSAMLLTQGSPKAGNDSTVRSRPPGPLPSEPQSWTVSISHRDPSYLSQTLKAGRIKASNVLALEQSLPLGETDFPASLCLVLSYLPRTADSRPADGGLLLHTNY